MSNRFEASLFAKELPVQPAMNMRERIREQCAQMRTKKNDLLLAAFQRRTGLDGTPAQIQENMGRFKRILSPGQEKVLLDGVPLIDFRDPEFAFSTVNPGQQDVRVSFGYIDHTLAG